MSRLVIRRRLIRRSTAEARRVGVARRRIRTFEVACCCVRKKVDSQDVGEAEWDPVSGALGPWVGAPLAETGGTLKNDGLLLEGAGDPTVSSAASLKGRSGVN